jgi:hypothetical protein
MQTFDFVQLAILGIAACARTSKADDRIGTNRLYPSILQELWFGSSLMMERRRGKEKKSIRRAISPLFSISTSISNSRLSNIKIPKLASYLSAYLSNPIPGIGNCKNEAHALPRFRCSRPGCPG